MKNRIVWVINTIVLIILLGFFILLKQKIFFCNSDFGPELNKKRKVFNIPIIPSSWHIKNKDNHSIYWIGKYGIIGHEGKTIVFLDCKIKEEVDLFILFPKKGRFRRIEITSKYKRNNRNTDQIFSYRLGDSVVTISNKIADSIFKMEKINKDY